MKLKVVVVVVTGGEQKLFDESPTGEAVAFSIGWELYDYFSSVEMIWESTPERAEKLINGRLALAKSMLIGYLDQLADLSPIKLDHVKIFNVAISKVEASLAETFRDADMNRIRGQIDEVRDFLDEEFTRDDFPNSESEKLEAMINGLFSEPRVADLKQNLRNLENSANAVVRNDANLLNFYRLGFELVRPTDPLLLDEIFPVEPNCLTDEDHGQSVISSRRKLLEDAQRLHVELQRVELLPSTNGYQLRDQISAILKRPCEEYKRYGLGLILYPKKMMFSRNGRGYVRLKKSGWSLLVAAAPSTKGVILTKQDLEAGYQGRRMKAKVKEDGKEHARDPIPMAKNRLNTYLAEVSLILVGDPNSQYQIVEIEET